MIVITSSLILALVTLLHTSVVNYAGLKVVYPKVIKAENGILRISGPIETGDAAIVQTEISRLSGTPNVLISSAGGDAREALIIAKEIRDRKANITIEGYCLSACAQYLFVAGIEKTIRPNALLGFHGTPTSMYQNLMNSSKRQKIMLFKKQAENEQKFYRQIGVNETLLSLSRQVLEPMCVIELTHNGRDAVSDYGVETAYNVYVLDKETLNLFGVNNIRGELPHDQQQLRNLVVLLPFKRELAPRSVRIDNLKALENYMKSHAPSELTICHEPFAQSSVRE